MFKKIAAQVVNVLDADAFDKRQAARKIVEYDPEFVYVAVRALTADKPNSNGDCFPHEELTRIDPVLNRPVYASFIGKGVYINHKSTDDPTIAKGVILDARYVQADANDRYVELLLGVDKKKDPVFARDIERGIINKFSMGASVQFTKCSVCDKEARRKEDFCDHIAKYKMREVQAADGTKKLAYEKCFGVTYNEISAVSDPADETAQTLAKIASDRSKKQTGEENSANASHGTVVLLNEIRASLKRVEAAVMKKVATKKVAAPMPGEAPPMEAPPADAAPAELPGEEMAEGAPQEEASEVVQVLDVIKELVEGRLPAADAVEAIEGLVGGAVPGAPGEMPPGEEAGEPMPAPMDMAPTARRKGFTALVDKLAKEYAHKITKREGAMSTKTAEESKSPKVENQYPYKKVQADPPQSESSVSKYKTHESRPASDFDGDAKEYAKLWNINAEFVPHSDKRQAAWVVADGETPLFRVTGAGAWEDMLDQKWAEFSDRSYGENLVKSILEEGLATTMDMVNATAVGPKTPVTAEATLDDKMLKAAEAKANDLANEKVADFKGRFLEGLKVAFTLQNKNVIENPIKAAAFEILVANGLDGSDAERIADSEIVQAHFDEAMKEALRYTEMSDAAFEEVKAHVESLPSTRVIEAREAGKTPEEVAEVVAEVAQAEMRRRAGVNLGGVRTASGATGQTALDERLREAVRSGSSVKAPPSRPMTYRPHAARA